MNICIRKVLNLELIVRLTMVTRVMKWLYRGVGVTNIGRFMPMFIMNRGYSARFSICFFWSKGNLKINILCVMSPLCLCSAGQFFLENFKKFTLLFIHPVYKRRRRRSRALARMAIAAALSIYMDSCAC